MGDRPENLYPNYFLNHRHNYVEEKTEQSNPIIGGTQTNLIEDTSRQPIDMHKDDYHQSNNQMNTFGTTTPLNKSNNDDTVHQMFDPDIFPYNNLNPLSTVVSTHANDGSLSSSSVLLHSNCNKDYIPIQESSSLSVSQLHSNNGNPLQRPYIQPLPINNEELNEKKIVSARPNSSSLIVPNEQLSEIQTDDVLSESLSDPSIKVPFHTDSSLPSSFKDIRLPCDKLNYANKLYPTPNVQCTTTNFDLYTPRRSTEAAQTTTEQQQWLFPTDNTSHVPLQSHPDIISSLSDNLITHQPFPASTINHLSSGSVSSRSLRDPIHLFSSHTTDHEHSKGPNNIFSASGYETLGRTAMFQPVTKTTSYHDCIDKIPLSEATKYASNPQFHHGDPMTRRVEFQSLPKIPIIENPVESAMVPPNHSASAIPLCRPLSNKPYDKGKGRRVSVSDAVSHHGNVISGGVTDTLPTRYPSSAIGPALDYILGLEQYGESQQQTKNKLSTLGGDRSMGHSLSHPIPVYGPLYDPLHLNKSSSPDKLTKMDQTEEKYHHVRQMYNQLGSFSGGKSHPLHTHYSDRLSSALRSSGVHQSDIGIQRILHSLPSTLQRGFRHQQGITGHELLQTHSFRTNRPAHIQHMIRHKTDDNKETESLQKKHHHDITGSYELKGGTSCSPSENSLTSPCKRLPLKETATAPQDFTTGHLDPHNVHSDPLVTTIHVPESHSFKPNNNAVLYKPFDSQTTDTQPTHDLFDSNKLLQHDDKTIIDPIQDMTVIHDTTEKKDAGQFNKDLNVLNETKSPSRLLIVVRRLPDKICPILLRRSSTGGGGIEQPLYSNQITGNISETLVRRRQSQGTQDTSMPTGSKFVNKSEDAINDDGISQTRLYNLTMTQAENIDWNIERNEFGLDFSRAFPQDIKRVVVADPSISFAHLSKNEDVQRNLRRSLRDYLFKRDIIPVFVDEYQGAKTERYSEEVLAPLFHYRTPPVSTGFHYLDWSGYKELNIAFLNTIAENYQLGDWILVFNYQLMLLPKMLRERPITREANVGFYLGTVFPSSEMYRILPQREELLRGVLAATFIGFHGFQYKRHFLTACTRVLGVECSGDRIEPNAAGGGAGCRVITVPRGINPYPWLKELQKPETQAKIADLREQLKGRKVLLGIDTLDYTKGIPNKMLAFNKFLTDHPEWASKVVFFQICVPKGQGGYQESTGFDQNGRISRVDRREILSNLYQLVGAINANFGNILNQPVHFLLSPLSVENLVCLYGLADIVVITPLRESLSWTAYEFVLCQSYTNKGVLILSEFSGSAQSLGAAAICVNPWDPNALAAAIHDALIMPNEEKLERHEYAFEYVLNYDSQSWGRELLSEFKEAVSDIDAEKRTIPPPLPIDTLVPVNFQTTSHRILILGLRGSLFSSTYRGIDPQLAGKVRLPRAVEAALHVLAEDSSTHILLVSSSPCAVLAQAVGQFPNITLMAENGHFERPAAKSRKSQQLENDVHMSQQGYKENEKDEIESIGKIRPEDSNHPVKHDTDTKRQGSIGDTMRTDRYPTRINCVTSGFIQTCPAVDLSWMDPVEESCRYFEQRTPGSFLYRTATSVAWNYRGAQRDHGASQARDLLIHLWAGPATVAARTDIVVGPHSVEVRSSATSKAIAIERWLRELLTEKDFDLSSCMVLCVANFLPRDEDVFSSITRVVESYTMRESETDSAVRSSSCIDTESSVGKRGSMTNIKTIGNDAENKNPILNCTAKIDQTINSNYNPLTNEANTRLHHPLITHSNPINHSDRSNHQINERIWMCTVGLKPSRADYLLADEKEVERLLTLLAALTIINKQLTDTTTSIKLHQPLIKESSSPLLSQKKDFFLNGNQSSNPSFQTKTSAAIITNEAHTDYMQKLNDTSHIQPFPLSNSVLKDTDGIGVLGPTIRSDSHTFRESIPLGGQSRLVYKRKGFPNHIDIPSLLKSSELQRALVSKTHHNFNPISSHGPSEMQPSVFNRKLLPRLKINANYSGGQHKAMSETIQLNDQVPIQKLNDPTLGRIHEIPLNQHPISSNLQPTHDGIHTISAGSSHDMGRNNHIAHETAVCLENNSNTPDHSDESDNSENSDNSDDTDNSDDSYTDTTSLSLEVGDVSDSPQSDPINDPNNVLIGMGTPFRMQSVFYGPSQHGRQFDENDMINSSLIKDNEKVD